MLTFDEVFFFSFHLPQSSIGPHPWLMLFLESGQPPLAVSVARSRRPSTSAAQCSGQLLALQLKFVVYSIVVLYGMHLHLLSHIYFCFSFLLFLLLFLLSLQRALSDHVQVNFVADGSRTQHGSFTAGLCLDSLIGAPTQDTRHRGSRSRAGVNHDDSSGCLNSFIHLF